MLGALTACFRSAFYLVDKPVQKEVAARFATMLGSEADSVIESYGDRFFRADDMAFLTDDDQAIVKAHILGRMQKPAPAMLDALSGIGSYLKKDDVIKFIDPLVLAVMSKSIQLTPVVNFLGFEHGFHTTAEFDNAMIKRLAAWKERAEERKDEAGLKIIEALNNAVDTIPF
jgi:hypothetical protein